MIKKFNEAFTMAEVLITLALIGILAITMISLNDFSGNNARIATQKLAQTDSALQSWSRAITASNETGVGATTFASAADPTEAIAESIKDYLANNNTEKGTNLVADNVEYNGEYESITLSNGVTVNVKFVADQDNLDSLNNNLALSNIAVITASVKENKNDQTPVTEEYALKASGLQSLSSVFEGWEKYKIEPVTIDGTDKRMYCPGKTECADGCKNAPEYCTVTEAKGNYIYKKESSRTACGSGQNGYIITDQIGSISGVFETTTNTCCNSPLVFDVENQTCACVDDASKKYITLLSGYAYDFSEDSTTCQVACEIGTYAKAGECTECEAGYYCDTAALAKHKPCPVGNYCPNDGMDKPEICPAGAYCPKKQMTEATECPEGYYCPEGSVKPTPCPVGTSNPNRGAKSVDECEPCDFENNNEYQDKTGQAECKICPDGSISIEGKYCKACPAGTFMDEDTKECKKCLAGYYQPGSGATECLPSGEGHYCPKEGMTEYYDCPCGTYQDEETGIVCKTVEAGYFPGDDSDEYVKVDAVQAVACPEGYKCQGGCHEKEECPVGQYQDKEAQSECIGCVNSSTEDKGSTSINDCLCNAGYYKKENSTVCEVTPCGTYSEDLDDEVYMCDDDTYNPNTGGKSDSDCIDVGENFVPTEDHCSRELSCSAGSYAYYTYDIVFAGKEGSNIQPLAISTKNIDIYRTNESSWNPFGFSNHGANMFNPWDLRNVNTSYNVSKGVLTIGYTTFSQNSSTDQWKNYYLRSNNKFISLADYASFSFKETSAQCVDAPCGTYVEEDGATAPTSCPYGTYNPNTGSDTSDDCEEGVPSIITDNRCSLIQPDAVYIIRYKATVENRNNGKENPSLYQQMMGTALGSGGFKLIKSDGKTTTNGDNSRQTTAGMKGAGLALSWSDRNRDFSKNIAYIVGVKYNPNPALETSDTDTKYKVVCSDGTVLGDKRSLKYLTETKKDGTTLKNNPCKNHGGLISAGSANIRKAQLGTDITKVQVSGGVLPLQNLYSFSRVIASFTPGTWYMHFTEEAVGGVKALATSKNWDTDIHNVSCKVYNGKKTININQNKCDKSDDGCDYDCNDDSATNIKVSCKSASAIKKATDDKEYFDGMVYNKYAVDCRSMKSSSATANFADYGDKYEDLDCDETCATDGLSGNKECIDSCDNVTIDESILNNGVKRGYDKVEFYSGGSINFYDMTIGVTESFLRYASPLILDLKGNGLKFTSLKDGVYFDLNADGIIEKISWTPKQTEFDDAFLVYDKNKNGIVDNGKELFGDQNGEENGFYELAKYDKNHDKVINKDDKIYSELLLWVDFNANGKSDAGEFKTLPEANVTEISIDYETQLDKMGNVMKDIYGNIVGFVGKFKMLVENAAGNVVEKIGKMIDVFFQTT